MFIEQEIAAFCRVTQEANVQKFNLLPASEWPYLPRRILRPCPNTRVLRQGREGHELCNKSLGGGGQQAVVAVLARLTIIIMFQPGSSHPQPVVSRFMDHGSYQDLLSLTLKPSSGGLEQLVTNFSSLRFSSSEKPSTTSQKVWMTG